MAADTPRLARLQVRRSARGVAKPRTGLELFIARLIAEAHDGSLDVEPVPAQGSLFELELPSGRG